MLWLLLMTSAEKLSSHIQIIYFILHCTYYTEIHTYVQTCARFKDKDRFIFKEVFMTFVRMLNFQLSTLLS